MRARRACLRAQIAELAWRLIPIARGLNVDEPFGDLERHVERRHAACAADATRKSRDLTEQN